MSTIKVVRVILMDQLSTSVSSLQGCNKSEDVIVMFESRDWLTRVKHHKKKIAFILSSMRHFYQQLSEQGYRVDYTKLEDAPELNTLSGELERILEAHPVDRIVVTHPGEYHQLIEIQGWELRFGVSVEIRPDDRFLCTPETFQQWSANRKQLRMEYFYREMRKRYNILMVGNDPIGGRWNYDADNRKTPEKKLQIPHPYEHSVDEISREVIELVHKEFADHFGELEPFYYAVTRKQALAVLECFVSERLAFFGDYQDAMLQGEPWMYHSHISFYLNIGLLLPMECIHAVLQAYENHQLPINAVEGFIRQILGWREYVRGVYWLRMPDYGKQNFFQARRHLPAFYWDANTDMNCLRQCVLETRKNAYAHHIQRLMVLGNFALLAGIAPEQVNEWFLIVYADAFEWVELPNVTGMILFADGGYLASKPYAAGGSYINKMSDYCKPCYFKVSQKNGSKACPFNYLYWDFMIRNRNRLGTNQRLAMMYKTLDRMGDEKKQLIIDDSRKFLDDL